MKKLFTLMVLTALAIAAFAQSPQKMSYQCVVRNSSGALVANQAIGMKISILQGSATGTVVFSETYSPNPQTNANGLVTVEIGSGTAGTGTFSGINWASGPFFLKTETDPAGGTSYTITGTSQLLSVPYALYAKIAANGFSGAWADVTGKPVFASVATSGSYNDLLNKPSLFSGSYNDLLNRPSLFSGAWADITGKPTTLTGYGITDADGSITNEIQSLSLSGTLLTLSNGGGTVTLPSSGGGDNWGTQVVMTNNTLTGNGTTATPLAVVNSIIAPLWTNVANKPTTLSGYGITDAMSTSHVANGVTSTYITNWNTAYGWGNHTGLYRPVSWVPTWSDVTGKPSFATVATSGSYNDLLNKPTLFDGTWNSLTGKPAGFADGIDNVDDADNSVTNEIQTLNLSGTTLSLSIGGGSVTLPSSGGGDNWGTQAVVTDATLAGNGTTATPLKIAQQAATSGQVLKWNGANWSPSNDNTGISLPFSGTATSGGPLFDIVNLGTSGAISTLSNGNYGIWGESASTSGIGLYGVNKTSAGTTYGVMGEVYSASGYSGYFQGGRFYIGGNVGIGAESPTARLHIKGTSPTNALIFLEPSEFNSAGDYAEVRFGDANHYIRTEYGNGMTFFDYDKFCFANSRMGIGTTNPEYTLDIAGNLNLIKGGNGDALWCNGAQALWWNGTYFSWGYSGSYNYFAKPITIGNVTNPTGYALWVQGNAWSTGAWLTSDIRYKKNITAIDNALDKLMKIRGTEYEFRTDEFEDYHFAEGPQLGFIAQELEEIFPELVNTDNNGYKSLNYNGMIPILLESIKEQQVQIESQQKQIDELKQLVITLVQK